MPKKLTDATLYSTATYYDDLVKDQVNSHKLAGPAISEAEYFGMMKRLGELEGTVIALSAKPATMPPEKEEMLNAALSRVDALEQELASTKKVLLCTSMYDVFTSAGKFVGTF